MRRNTILLVHRVGASRMAGRARFPAGKSPIETAVVARVRCGSMAVTREKLFEEVWAEPMTIVATRYGVSSSFLARVCERLNVPRPARGHWARLEVGKASPRPALSEARPGDELEWSRDGERRRVPRERPTPPEEGAQDPRRASRHHDAQHELLAGAREHFDGAKVSENGYLRPAKKRLVDVFVTKGTLARALDTLNALFFALEDHGHRVTFAPLGQHLHRPDVDERSKGGRDRYGYGRWAPDRATIVYVGTVAIGLTAFELSEDVEVQYVDGKYVRVDQMPPPASSRRRAPLPSAWTHKRDMPSGMLCLRASSPYGRAPWEKQWRESKGSELTSKIPQIVRELASESAVIAKLVEKGERQAEIERKQREIQHEEWRREEAERRRVQKTKESREHLFAIIDGWGAAKRIEGFFEDAERRAASLGADERDAMRDRLASRPGIARRSGCAAEVPRVEGVRRAGSMTTPSTIQ